MGPVTTNPWLIALINMTIVFGVLIALGACMKILQIIDPTKKKSNAPVAAAAPKAAPKAAAAPAAPAKDNNEIIAVIAAAVAAAGCSADQIASVRVAGSKSWILNARAEAISVRKECF